MTEQKQRVVIPPEVLEQMQRDIPAEELQQIFTHLAKMIEDKTVFDHAEPIDLNELQRADPEEYAALMVAVQNLGYDTVDELLEDESKDWRTLN